MRNKRENDESRIEQKQHVPYWRREKNPRDRKAKNEEGQRADEKSPEDGKKYLLFFILLHVV
jgi:hypothetical protein